MFFFNALFVVSLLNFLHDFHVSGNDKNCTYEPVFTPSRLVAKFGDPTSAMCSICQHDCPNDLFGLEKSVGVATKNGTKITWTVDKMTEWDISPMCYFTDNNENQCFRKLSITVYQPPKNVHFSFLNHSGPMFAGHQYTLQCTVQEVAPIENLIVTFYRGQTALGQRQLSYTEKRPVNESFTLNINPSKEDGRDQYWCEAKLELGAEGPQPPPVVTSQNISATVYYKPQLKGSSNPKPIIVTKGDPLQLNCSAVGNPSPSYTWTNLSGILPPIDTSILTIDKVTLEHRGQINCSVGNSAGTVIVTFNVDVKENYTNIIIVVVSSVIALVGLAFAIVVVYLYKQHRMGNYNLKDVFFRPTRHVAVPNEV